MRGWNVCLLFYVTLPLPYNRKIICFERRNILITVEVFWASIQCRSFKRVHYVIFKAEHERSTWSLRICVIVLLQYDNQARILLIHVSLGNINMVTLNKIIVWNSWKFILRACNFPPDPPPPSKAREFTSSQYQPPPLIIKLWRACWFFYVKFCILVYIMN
jgi:hypothetical protein